MSIIDQTQLSKVQKLNNQPFFTPEQQKILIREFLSTKKPSTANSYRKCIARFTRKYKMFSFTTIAEWHQFTQNNERFSNSYIRSSYATISAFFEYCKFLGIFKTNPVRLFKNQARDGSARAYPALPSEDIQNILKEMDYEHLYINLVRFQLLSGVRAREVLSLGSQLYHKRTKTLTILGKGSRRRKLTLTNELSKLRNRIVKNEYLLLPENCTEKEFNLIYKRYQIAILEIIARRGLTAFSSHSLRATYASNLYDKGFPIEQISIVLGHTSIDMTKNYIERLRGKQSLAMPTSDALYGPSRSAKLDKSA